MEIGDMVKFKIPSLHGPSLVAGFIKRILPDGRYEVKSQQGEYWTLTEAECVKVNR